MIVSINGSPFHLGKRELREEMFRAMVRRHNVPAIVVNQVGGNDQIVFDGTSFAMDADGKRDRLGGVVPRRPRHCDISDGRGRHSTRICRTNAKPFTKRWCSARAITFASAVSSAF